MNKHFKGAFKMCEYVFKNGEKCKEEALKGSKYCILHIPFPKDRNSKEFKRIAKLKEEKVKEKISKGDFNFEGAKLLKIDFSHLEIKGNVNFSNAVILEDVLFLGAKIGRNALFDGAKIGRDARFAGAEIGGDASFFRAKIGGFAFFAGAKIGRDARFNGAEIGEFALFAGAEIGGLALFEEVKIGGFALFDGAKIGRDARFYKTKIGGRASFNAAEIEEDALFNAAEIEEDALFLGAKIGRLASFEEAEIGTNALFQGAEIGENASFFRAEIGGDASFYRAKIGESASFNRAIIVSDASFNTLNVKGILSFKGAVFKEPEVEENACRAARRSYERFGDRETADRYFLQEMRARRKQKNKFKQFFEWLIADFTCQYGTNFIIPIAIWLVLVLGVFPFIYYFGHGITSPNPLFPFFNSVAESAKSFASAEYFSIVTATTLGYGDLRPASTAFRLIASFEAIFGTFMWVIFLTVFARKYMR